MKLCFIVNDLNNKAGTERSVTLIANRMSEIGHDVSILSFVKVINSGYSLHENIRVLNLNIKCKNFKLGYLKVIKELKKIFVSNDFDVIIEAEVYNRLFTIIPTRNLRTKIVTWEHFNYFVTLGRKERGFARKLAAKYSDAIVTLTERDKKNYEENEKCIAKVTAIENTLVFYPEELARLSVNNVLAVGRLTYQKGFDMLLEAWSELKKTDPNNNWILNIVGNGEDKEKLLKQISDNNISESVKINEPTSNIQEYYKNSSIYVMTSRFEGFPMVLIEAMSYGIPVVSFDCPTGPADLINNNQNGFLCKMNDITDVSDSLLKLMSSHNLRKNFGEESRKEVERLNIENISAKWEHLFKDIGV